MRIYWLAGLFLFAAAMAAASLWFERMRKHLSLCMPILASFGTLFFAVACQQTFFSVEVAAIIGITVAGAGYGWFACLYCIILAKTQKMVFVIGSIVSGIALKTLFVQTCALFLPVALHVGTALILPFALSLLAWPTRYGDDTRIEYDEVRPLPGKYGGYRYLTPQIIVSVFALATTRVLTPLGFFGDPLGMFSGTIPALTGSIGTGIILAIVAYFALMRRTKIRLSTRFLPAFLVVILAFFVSIFSSSYQGTLAALSEITITAAELFAHALFWTIVATAIRLQKDSSFRVIGFSTGLYDLISIIWITLFFSLGATNNAIILLVVFLVVSLLIWLADKSDAAQTTMPPEPIADKRQEIATRYALSPRETEVFMMLAQGRSRTYISEELFISDGTTKTHISHIYKKLEVSNKQEMFDILLQDHATKADKGHRPL